MKHGIILANTGSPSSPNEESVRKYLKEFLRDPRIMPVNRVLKFFLLNFVILPRRCQKSTKKYQQIWSAEGAPLVVMQEKLAQKLEASLCNKGIDAYVRSAMNFGTPSIKQAVLELRDLGCEQLHIVPMYPQSAFSTTYAVKDKIDAAVKDILCNFIDSYPSNERYIQAIAQNIKNAGFGQCADDHLVFSYHSIPLDDINNGDTYFDQIRTSSALIAKSLGLDGTPDQIIANPLDNPYKYSIVFQSRFEDNRNWLSPFESVVLPHLATKTKSRIFVVCPNFAIDCLETLYEVEIKQKQFFIENRKATDTEFNENCFIYVPCLNDTDTHVQILEDILF